MNVMHSIRLRGPWEVSVLDAPRLVSHLHPVKMPCPCTWREGGWSDFLGRALHIRRFGWPRQLDADERVWLVIEPSKASLALELNGSHLASALPGIAIETEVTKRLLQRNELRIEVSGKNADCGLTGEVRLEIRA